jgi:regulator of sirC expression with transglutaminase-like and TPR domain
MVISETENQPDILSRLVEVHQALAGPSDPHAIFRAVNFMTYELATQLRELNSDELLPTFNRFFFAQKNFRLGPSYFIHELVESREGCPILVALIYMYLGNCCEMKMNLVHWPMHTVIRWESSPGKFAYIDLEKNGQLLSAEEILALVCKHKKELLPLNTQESVLQYLAYLSLHFRNHSEPEKLHIVLNLILNIEPENTRYLAERAMLRRDLGHVKEALQDLKRYFAFTNSEATAPEIVSVFEELKVLAPALS